MERASRANITNVPCISCCLRPRLKSMRFYEIDVSPQRPRSQPGVSVGAAGRALHCKYMKIQKIYENLGKSNKIDGNLCESMKYNKSHQRPRSQPAIDQSLLFANSCFLGEIDPILQNFHFIFDRYWSHIQDFQECIRRVFRSFRPRLFVLFLFRDVRFPRILAFQT